MRASSHDFLDDSSPLTAYAVAGPTLYSTGSRPLIEDGPFNLNPVSSSLDLGATVMWVFAWWPLMHALFMRKRSRVPMHSYQGHARPFLSFCSRIYGDANDAGFSTTSLHLRFQLLSHPSSALLPFIASHTRCLLRGNLSVLRGNLSMALASLRSTSRLEYSSRGSRFRHR